MKHNQEVVEVLAVLQTKGKVLLKDLHMNVLIQSQPSLETAGLPMEALPTKGASHSVSSMLQCLEREDRFSSRDTYSSMSCKHWLHFGDLCSTGQTVPAH
jgi:hypothetical protein